MLALSDDSRDQILEWAREAGLIETQVMWRTWTWDDENESWGYMLFSSLDDALDQLDELPEEYEDLEAFLEEQLELLPPLPQGASKLIEETAVDVLTDLGHERSGGRIDHDADAADIAITFWTEDVLQQEHPDVVGVWWQEEYEPENLSAPRGAILPSRINEIEFTPVHWNSVPDDEELLEAMPSNNKLIIGDRSPSLAYGNLT